MASLGPNPTLADIRREIDRLDEGMHRLLMERGEVIDTLIEVKKTQASGSAFRPGREAEMMKRLAERHHGSLPFDVAESIWRVIIATFTYVQAPYSVHADIAGGDAPMRDSARFHFGFTVPLIAHDGASAVIDAVQNSAGDLGLFLGGQKIPLGFLALGNIADKGTVEFLAFIRQVIFSDFSHERPAIPHQVYGFGGHGAGFFQGLPMCRPFGGITVGAQRIGFHTQQGGALVAMTATGGIVDV